MKMNLLKLFDDKTELLVKTSRPSTSHTLDISIKVDDHYISPSDKPSKKLKVIFVQHAALEIMFLMRVWQWMQCIFHWQKYLDLPTVEKLMNDTITASLDYFNNIILCIPRELMPQLQRHQIMHLVPSLNGPLSTYVKLRVAHALRMPGTFSRPRT